MCRAAAEDGVRVVVATPLWVAGNAEPPVAFDKMSLKIARLQDEFLNVLTVKPGFIFEFSMSLPELVDKYGSRITLGGNDHLLVSLPSTIPPAGANGVWKALAKRGVFVVLARPECSPALRRDPSLLDDWAREGMKFQIDAASVSGGHGRGVQKFAFECLRKFEGKTVVASNAQKERSVSLVNVRAGLASQLGKRQAAMCFRDTPIAILGDANAHPGGQLKASASGLTSLLRAFNLQ